VAAARDIYEWMAKVDCDALGSLAHWDKCFLKSFRMGFTYRAQLQSEGTMKNLIVCLDGTFNGMHGEARGLTNISYIADLAANTDLNSSGKPKQVVHYEDGVGVGSFFIDKLISGASGRGVFTQARRAWKFLKLNYSPGDRIYIFGFSRGAYAARQLASMVVHCGVGNTTFDNLEDGFRTWFKVAGAPVKTPRQLVHFLGLFDCVPGNQLTGEKANRARLNSTDIEYGIKHFRHALSRDERRWAFKPLVFKRNPENESFDQLVFPGFHGDVGGGGDSNKGLATVAVWWMAREAYRHDMELGMIRCQSKHHEGNSTFVGAIDILAKPVCSDYPWTKWINHSRPRSSEFEGLTNAPDIEDMAACPKCPHDMFNYDAILMEAVRGLGKQNSGV
jgi:uncharacterized protein (DUF2235 family)